jgi:hypothetical protein
LDATSIGRRSLATPTGYFSGTIGQVCVWNIALDATEIADASRWGTCDMVRPDKLVRWYPVRGVGTTEVEIVSGNGMSVTGATAASHHRIGMVQRWHTWMVEVAPSGQPMWQRRPAMQPNIGRGHRRFIISGIPE